MPKQTKTCRVCGKTYEACRSIKTGNDTFNWREVACSPECGEKYFRQVEAARGKAAGAGVQPAFGAKPKKAVAANTAFASGSGGEKKDAAEMQGVDK